MEQLIQKILDSGKLTKAELDERVASKLDSLGGLISEEGALHIIANELGLNSPPVTQATVVLNEVSAGMRNVGVVAKVLRKYELRHFGPEGTGKVASVFIGDESGSLRLTFWNDKTTYFEDIKEGDTIEVQQAYSRENNGRTELHMGNSSLCIINPEGKTVTVKDAAQPAETPSKKLQEINEQDQFVNITATIVQAYDPRFFASDPQTKKRIPDDQLKGGEEFNYVMNVFLDDGSHNMRAAVWKEQVQELLGMSDTEILALRTDATKLEDVKTDLLGRIITARARVKKNEAYNNMELVLYQINTNPEPVTVSTVESAKEEPVVEAAEATPVAQSAPVAEAAATTEPAATQLVSNNEVVEELLADDDEELLSIDDLEDQL